MAYEEVEQAVAIVVDPGAAGAEVGTFAQEAGFFRDVGEHAFAAVVEEDVLAVTSDEDVVETVVIVIGDGDSGCPDGTAQAGLRGYVFECAVAIIVIQANGGFGWSGAGAALACEDYDVLPAIVVVIDEGYAAADGFLDVVGSVFVAVDYGRVKAGLLGYVCETGVIGDAGGCAAWNRSHSS